VSASEVTHSEEKHPEEKVDISLLSQGNENQTHEESEISSLEGMETDIQDDLLFTEEEEEEEEALNREPTAEERLTAEWMFSRITSTKYNVGRKDG